MESSQGPAGPQQRHWHEQKFHDVSGRGRARRNESGDCHNRRWESIARKVSRIVLIRGETRRQCVITVVRVAVAKFESTPVTPIFAGIAVAPANRAESNDHVSQLFIYRRKI